VFCQPCDNRTEFIKRWIYEGSYAASIVEIVWFLNRRCRCFWVNQGPEFIWKRLFDAVSDDPDMEYTMVDATIVKVHRHGQGAKGGPVPPLALELPPLLHRVCQGRCAPLGGAAAPVNRRAAGARGGPPVPCDKSKFRRYDRVLLRYEF
jgi:hypothetical protein